MFSIFVVPALLGCLSLVSGQATETRALGKFSGIAADGPFAINVEIGKEEKAVLSGDKKFIAAVGTIVENGTLKVRFINWDLKFTGILQITVTAKEKSLINLVSAGPSQITSETTLSGRSIRAVASGSSKIVASFATDNLDIVVSQSASLIGTATSKNLNAVLADSGAITITGKVDNANVVVSGSGVFHGSGLDAGSVASTVSGSGRAEVNAKNLIKLLVTDNGVVKTSGKAEVDKEVQDLGSVEEAV